MTQIRIGTRGSLLARAQAAHVAQLVAQHVPGVQVSLEVIAVSGDAPADAARADGAAANGAPADKQRWVDRIEDALRDGRIDLAVHSAKDLPGELPDDMALLAAPVRADARDALCGAPSVSALAPGARVGTTSLRRAAQLRALRADLDVVALAGNVDTRLRRLSEGACDALVLAAAGLQRLGRLAEAGALLDPHEFVPAPGQGTLALESRAGDRRAIALATAICDPPATAQLVAERALVREIEASCHTPVGAHAVSGPGGELVLVAFVGLPDGSAWVRDRLAGDGADPEELGRLVAQRLLAAGAREILAGAVEMAGAVPSA